MEIFEIITTMNSFGISYLLLKNYFLINKKEDKENVIIDHTPKENLNHSRKESRVSLLELPMTQEGWDQLEKNISTKKGVYLHFAKTDNGYLPLRIGMTAAKRGFKDRWSNHRKAFESIRKNNFSYISKYPNYSFFFDDIREIFPKTVLLFVEIEYEHLIKKIEDRMIKYFSPLWEELYVRRKWETWKDDIHTKENVKLLIENIYIKPKINSFEKHTSVLINKIENLGR